MGHLVSRGDIHWSDSLGFTRIGSEWRKGERGPGRGERGGCPKRATDDSRLCTALTEPNLAASFLIFIRLAFALCPWRTACHRNRYGVRFCVPRGTSHYCGSKFINRSGNVEGRGSSEAGLSHGGGGTTDYRAVSGLFAGFLRVRILRVHPSLAGAT